MVLGAILSVLASVIGGAISAGKEVVGAISNVVQALFSIIQTWIQSAPSQFKVFIFLFFIVSLGNVFSSFVLGMDYACDSQAMLYKSPDVISGLGSQIRTNFFS
jgi:hypothetical protein